MHVAVPAERSVRGTSVCCHWLYLSSTAKALLLQPELPNTRWFAWHPSSPSTPANEQVLAWLCSSAVLGPGSDLKQSILMPAHLCTWAASPGQELCPHIRILVCGCLTAEPKRTSTSLGSPQW